MKSKQNVGNHGSKLLHADAYCRPLQSVDEFQRRRSSPPTLNHHYLHHLRVSISAPPDHNWNFRILPKQYTAPGIFCNMRITQSNFETWFDLHFWIVTRWSIHTFNHHQMKKLSLWVFEKQYRITYLLWWWIVFVMGFGPHKHTLGWFVPPIPDKVLFWICTTMSELVSISAGF